MTDEQLGKIIQKAKQGKQTAITDLYEHTKDYSYFVAQQYVEADDIGDVLQESYLSVFQSLNTFDDSKKFKPWLHTIVRNKALDHLRKHNRVKFTPIEEIEDLEDFDATMPNELLEQADKRSDILAIIESLPVGQKTVVRLFYLDDLTISEISETLDVSIGTVKKQLNTARKTIKDKVLLEESRGNKLYTAAPLPFLKQLFEMEMESGLHTIPAEMSKQVLAGTLQGLGITGSSIIGGVGIMALSATTKTVLATAGAIAVVAGIGIPIYNNYQKEQQALLAQQQQEEEAKQAEENQETKTPDTQVGAEAPTEASGVQFGVDANGNPIAGIYIGNSGGSLTPEQEREYEKAKQEIAQQLEDLQKQYDKAQASKGSSSTAPDVKVQPPKTEKPADGTTGGSAGVIPAFDTGNQGFGGDKVQGGSGTSATPDVKWG